jgi:hypothetical protein
VKRPSVLYPTLKKGIIIANEVRCESIDGSELYLKPFDLPCQVFDLDYDADRIPRVRFENYPPFEINGKTYFLTHLQYRARYFSLLYDPFIYHQGRMIRPQEKKMDKDGVLQNVPGTEIFPYWRTCGWRWQLPDARSEGTPWEWSWGRVPGLHLD